jgi:hypothetical protein
MRRRAAFAAHVAKLCTEAKLRLAHTQAFDRYGQECASSIGDLTMTRLSSLLAFAATLAACLTGAFSLSWWLACGLAAILVPASLAQRRAAYGRAGAERHPEAPAAPLVSAVSATLDLATGLAIGFAIGRVLAWLWVG